MQLPFSKIQALTSARRLTVACICIGLVACTPLEGDPKPGPDKAGSGLLAGAALGAGSGAVTGAQFAAGSGPGMWVGMGFGAVLGLFSGLGDDFIEEQQIENADQARRLREKAFVQEVLAEHYKRRLELHPNRDIFPADIFFEGDSQKLKYDAKLLTKGLAELAKRRMVWSRVRIVAYMMAKDPNSAFAKKAADKRAEEMALIFVQSGIDPRRVEAQGVVLPGPLLIDPDDSPSRYRQAIELISVDR